VLEFTCWNSEIVRVAFALDCHDRDVIGWTATKSKSILPDQENDARRATELARGSVRDVRHRQGQLSAWQPSGSP
jgi:hypothetical protein